MKNATSEYKLYKQAYEYFNEHLFSGELPPCLITLQRKVNTYGYYAPNRFVARTNSKDRTDEIALNPDTFANCTDKDILSTLVHEMSHLWQAHFGKPGRGRYHNREWAHKMVTLGLLPVSLDNPGKMTGQAVTHEIIPNGPFDAVADQLMATGFCLNWQSFTYSANLRAPITGVNGNQGSGTPVPLSSKVKYTCASCSQNAWAKPKACLFCGHCLKYMESSFT
jgi:SprT-like family